MYAVVKTGGKQYKVAKDDVILVEKLTAEAGQTVDLTDVLMIGDGADTKLGSPLIDGAAVKAEVLKQTRGEKILVFKKKRRQGYRRKKGHRQDLTALKITEILAKGAPKQAAAKAEAPAKAAAKTEAKAPAEKPEAKTETKTEAKPKAPAKKAPAKTETKPKTEAKTEAKAPAKKAPAKKPAAAKEAAPKEAAAAKKPAPKRKAPAKKPAGETKE